MRARLLSVLNLSLQQRLRNHANRPIEKPFDFYGDEPALSATVE
jgi:hypothetical protein